MCRRTGDLARAISDSESLLSQQVRSLARQAWDFVIAATDLGIGTGHSSVGEQGKARAILGVPEGYEVAYLLGVGYPAEADPQAEPTAVR